MIMVVEVDRVDFYQCHAPIRARNRGFDHRTRGYFSRAPWAGIQNEGGGSAIIPQNAISSIFPETRYRARGKSIIIHRSVQHIWGRRRFLCALQHMGSMTDIGYHEGDFRSLLVFRGQHIWRDMAMSGAWYIMAISREYTPNRCSTWTYNPQLTQSNGSKFREISIRQLSISGTKKCAVNKSIF